MNFLETRRAAPSSHTPELTSPGAAETSVPMSVAPTQTLFFFFSCQAQNSSQGKGTEGYGLFGTFEY